MSTPKKKCRYCGTNGINPPEFNNYCGQRCYEAGLKACGLETAVSAVLIAGLLAAAPTQRRRRVTPGRVIAGIATLGMSEIL